MKITREKIIEILNETIWINDECGFDGDGERKFKVAGIKFAADAIMEHLSTKDRENAS